jgi:hypothetical protein
MEFSFFYYSYIPIRYGEYSWFHKTYFPCNVFLALPEISGTVAYCVFHSRLMHYWDACFNASLFFNVYWWCPRTCVWEQPSVYSHSFHELGISQVVTRNRHIHDEMSCFVCTSHVGRDITIPSPFLWTHCNWCRVQYFFIFFFFLVAPTRGSVLPFQSIGLILLSFLIRTVGRTPWTGD